MSANNNPLTQLWSPFTPPVQGGRNLVWSRPSGAGDVNGDGYADFAIPYLESEGGVQLELAIFPGGPGFTLGDGDLDDPADALWLVEGRSAEAEIQPLLTSWPVGDTNGDGLDDVAVVILPFSTPGFQDPVTDVYIVFGQTDGTTRTLSQIRAGQGGVRLRDPVGAATRLAVGDLDGDGLSDVLWNEVTAADLTVDGGRVEAWFGSDPSGLVVTQTGTPAAESFVGTAGRDSVVAGRGDDEMLGLGGPDVLYGGSGDDRASIGDTAFVRVDGGRGIDTLEVLAAALDVPSLGLRLRGIEVFDLTSGAVDLVLDDGAVNRLPDAPGGLTVLADGDDSVTLLGNGWDWEDPFTLVAGQARVSLPGGVQVQAAPRIETLNLQVPEDTVGGTILATIAVGDIDGDVPALDVDVTSAGGLLSFDPGTRELTLVSAGLDFETVPRFLLPAAATDGSGLQTFATIELRVLDVNEPPVIALAADSVALAESPPRVVFYQAAATDPDVGDTLTWSLAAGNEDGAFAVDPTTGEIRAENGWLLDYERQPPRSLVVAATDAGGLSDTLALDVNLLDLAWLDIDLGIAFSSYDPNLLDNYDNPVGFLAPAAIDASENLDYDEPTPAFVFDDPLGVLGPVDFFPSVAGDVRTTLDLSLAGGTMNLQVPMRARFRFPDNVVPGASVLVQTDVSLEPEATVAVATPSMAADLGVEATGISGGLSSGAVSDFLPSWDSPGAMTLGFDLPERNAQGVPLSVAFPDGVDTTGQAACLASCARVSACFDDVRSDGFAGVGGPPECAEGGHLDDACWDAIFLAGDPTPLPACGAALSSEIALCQDSIASCLAVPLVGVDTMNVFAAAVPEATGQAAYTNNRMLVTPGVDVQGIHQSLDLGDVMASAGLPVFGFWWGSANLPLDPVGYASFRYDLWSATWTYDLRVYAQYLVEVDEVYADLTFEDGSQLTLPLTAGSTQIVIPSTADQNSDGIVMVDANFRADATATQIWLWNQELDWNSALLQVLTSVYQYDLLEPSGESLVLQFGFGPVRQTTTVVPFPDLQVDSWSVEGLGTDAASFGVQTAP